MGEECLATPVIIASLYEEPLRVDIFVAFQSGCRVCCQSDCM
jgi:hypothetical protein